MTYYPDLSKYSDWPVEQPLLNVGWLGRGHDFPVGDVPDEFIVALTSLIANHTVMVIRSMHECELCDVESGILFRIGPDGLPIPWRKEDGRPQVALGPGDVWAVGANGEVYAAPTLVLHFVQAHRYRPPDVFIEAVLATASGKREIDGPFYAQPPK